MFRENLKFKMKELGLTAKDLAARMETPEDRAKGVKLFRNIENWTSERGSIPGAERAVDLAQALGVTVEYLVKGKETQLSFEESKLLNLAKKYQNFLTEFEMLDNESKKFIIEIVSHKATLYREEQKKRNA